jgi:hypothetical protein
VIHAPPGGRTPAAARTRKALLWAGIPLAAGLALYLVLPPRPQPIDWTPVYRGIEMRCEESAAGRLMALRVNLDEPTLELMMRPPDPGAVARGGHYFLAFAVLERWRHGLAVLMNTTMYEPHEKWRSYPGQTVRAVDTVVINGAATHIHPHSYLLWLAQDRTPHMETEKPPPPASVRAAAWGIGLQGVQVGEGQPRYHAMDGHGVQERRSFIGFHSKTRRLYLIAWESAEPREMIDTAIRLGVEWGGQLDSGSASHLLLGGDVRGVRPFTGLHGGRPLGPYLGIRAAALR